MADWIEDTAYITLLNEQGQRILPREQHTYRWRIDRHAVSFRHVSPHVFEIPEDRPAFSIVIEDDTGRMLGGYRILGGPITGRLEIEGEV